MKKVPMKTFHITILILGSIFILLSIFHTSLWFDETYSVGIANHSFTEIWTIGGNDVHPILYYWMLRIVCLLTGGSIFAYRIFSVIPIILTALIGFTHTRKDFGEKTGILFSVFTFFLPVSAIYANQIRMYSWAILILTLFFIYAYRLYKGEESIKNWTIFGITSLCSIYIHYYGLMAAGITNILLLIYFVKNKNKKAIRNILILGIGQLLLYLPWIIYFINQLKHVSEGFWIELHLEDILKIVGCQLIGNLNVYVGVILSVILYIYLLKVICQKKKQLDKKPIIFSVGIYLMVVLVAIILQNVLKTPILYHRYLFVITGLYIFVISYVLAQEENKKIVYAVCIIIFLLGVMNTVLQIKENYKVENMSVVRYLNENISKEDAIVYDNIGNGSIVAVNFKENRQFFYNPEDWKVNEAYKAYGPQMQTYTTNEFIEDLPKRIWVIDTLDEKLYQQFFNNHTYTIIKQKEITTDYNEVYQYNIKLIEKNKG